MTLDEREMATALSKLDLSDDSLRKLKANAAEQIAVHNQANHDDTIEASRYEVVVSVVVAVHAIGTVDGREQLLATTHHPRKRDDFVRLGECP